MALLLNEANIKSLGSQAKKEQIDTFVRKNVQGHPDFSGQFVDPEPLTQSSSKKGAQLSIDQVDSEVIDEGSDQEGRGHTEEQGQGGRGKPKKPKKRRYVPSSAEIEDALEALGSQKLSQLYFSITTVSVLDHPQLIGVGIWSFLTSLASLMGAGEEQALAHWFKPGRISDLGVATGQSAKNLNKVIEDVSRGGNLGKHHAVAGQFDAEQIITNFEAIEELVAASLRSVSSLENEDKLTKSNG